VDCFDLLHLVRARRTVSINNRQIQTVAPWRENRRIERRRCLRGSTPSRWPESLRRPRRPSVAAGGTGAMSTARDRITTPCIFRFPFLLGMVFWGFSTCLGDCSLSILGQVGPINGLGSGSFARHCIELVAVDSWNALRRYWDRARHGTLVGRGKLLKNRSRPVGTGEKLMAIGGESNRNE